MQWATYIMIYAIHMLYAMGKIYHDICHAHCSGQQLVTRTKALTIEVQSGALLHKRTYVTVATQMLQISTNCGFLDMNWEHVKIKQIHLRKSRIVVVIHVVITPYWSEILQSISII